MIDFIFYPHQTVETIKRNVDQGDQYRNLSQSRVSPVHGCILRDTITPLSIMISVCIFLCGNLLGRLFSDELYGLEHKSLIVNDLSVIIVDETC